MKNVVPMKLFEVSRIRKVDPLRDDGCGDLSDRLHRSDDRIGPKSVERFGSSSFDSRMELRSFPPLVFAAESLSEKSNLNLEKSCI